MAVVLEAGDDTKRVEDATAAGTTAPVEGINDEVIMFSVMSAGRGLVVEIVTEMADERVCGDENTTGEAGPATADDKSGEWYLSMRSRTYGCNTGLCFRQVSNTTHTNGGVIGSCTKRSPLAGFLPGRV